MMSKLINNKDILSVHLHDQQMITLLTAIRKIFNLNHEGNCYLKVLILSGLRQQLDIYRVVHTNTNIIVFLTGIGLKSCLTIIKVKIKLKDKWSSNNNNNNETGSRCEVGRS